jgi:hypothetical protein
MGMKDLGIQDFQIKASSEQINHEASHARPQKSGWCADFQDAEPFLQVNLHSYNKGKSNHPIQTIFFKCNNYPFSHQKQSLSSCRFQSFLAL